MRRILVVGLAAAVVTCGAVHVYNKKEDASSKVEQKIDLGDFVSVVRMNLVSTIHLRGRTQPASSTSLRVPNLQMVYRNNQLRSYIQRKGARIPRDFRSLFLVEDGTYVEKGEIVATFDMTDYHRILDVWVDFIAEQEMAYETLLAKNRETRETYRDEMESQVEQVQARHKDLVDYLRQDAHEKRAAIQTREQKARIAYNAAKERVSGLEKLLSDTGSSDANLRASLRAQIADAEKAATTQLSSLRDAVADGSRFQTKQYHEDIEQHEALIRLATRLHAEKADEIKKRLEQMEAQESKQYTDLEQQKIYLKNARKEADLLNLRAPRSGSVTLASWLFYRRDRPIRMGQTFGQIPNDDDWRVHVGFPQVLRPRIHQGMTVSVRFLNPSVTVPGKIQDVQGTSRAIIKVNTEVKGLSVGVLSLIEIPEARRDNVLCVPIESIVTEDGHDFCMVREGQGCDRREVKCGVRNNRFVEIVSGVEEDELVLRHPRLLTKNQPKPTR